MPLESHLYIVSTPIGNLKDITYRAIEVLSYSVDKVLSEDTRNTGKLLKYYEIDKKQISLHQHNEHKKVYEIIELMEAGEVFAYMTDAGTPGISDPGYLLVKEALKKDLRIQCLPGATALIPALVLSGLPCDEFNFAGFLPHKKGRKKKIKELHEQGKTFILYESPYRLVKALKDLARYAGGEIKASVSKELTKKFEETHRGSIDQLISEFENRDSIKGEYTIVVEGSKYKQKSK